MLNGIVLDEKPQHNTIKHIEDALDQGFLQELFQRMISHIRKDKSIVRLQCR